MKALQKQSLNPTNGEEILKHTIHLRHLRQGAFCWDKVADRREKRWFVVVDLSECICEQCYQDFRIQFDWKLLDGWDLDWKEETFGD